MGFGANQEAHLQRPWSGKNIDSIFGKLTGTCENHTRGRSDGKSPERQQGLRVHARWCIEGVPRKKPEPQSALAGAGYGKRRLDFEWIDLSRDREEKEGCRDQGRGDKNKPSIVLNRNALEEKCKTNSVYCQVYLILHKGETEKSPRKRIYPLSTVIC